MCTSPRHIHDLITATSIVSHGRMCRMPPTDASMSELLYTLYIPLPTCHSSALTHSHGGNSIMSVSLSGMYAPLIVYGVNHLFWL